MVGLREKYKPLKEKFLNFVIDLHRIHSIAVGAKVVGH
jgi:hypothetical protein